MNPLWTRWDLLLSVATGSPKHWLTTASRSMPSPIEGA
jgi:hypothetical protein